MINTINYTLLETPVKDYIITHLKSKKPLIALLIFISVASFYILQNHAPANREPYFINWTMTNTISCHYVTEGDALQPARDLAPSNASIFFHETSCRGGLNSRQACVVESAARKHPACSVYVFFNSPVSEAVLTRSCLAKLAQFNNVRLARLHTKEYAKGTALRKMLAHKKHNRSPWRIELTSDLLRYISMYKYGGIYLDTDVLVVKPLDSLGKDWVAKEDDVMVNVAVMAIGKEGVGHDLVAKILEDLRVNFRPELWQHHGPGAMTRALLNHCNVSSVAKLNNDVCRGFKVLDRAILYPVHYSKSHTYFDIMKPEDVTEFLKKENRAYTHHLWNKGSKDMTVAPGSIYDTLAWQHCPTIREMYGDWFGS